jgi:hypothetical protein
MPVVLLVAMAADKQHRSAAPDVMPTAAQLRYRGL